jgi:hypothetical protein
MTSIETVVRVLAAAFADDPLARWLLPGDLAAEIVFRRRTGPYGGRGLAAAPDRTVG